MLKRRVFVPAALVLAAVTVTGVAAATHHAQATQAAAADFTAASVSRNSTQTCTAADGTYQLTSAKYTGTATSSDPRLNGTLEIRVSSVLNTNSKLGWLSGDFRVRGASGAAHGTIHAAISNGSAVGSIVGRGSGDSKLVASVSALFGQSTGFTGGKLGSGSANGAGVFFTRGECKRAKRVPSTAIFREHLTPRQVVPPVNGLRAEAKGNVTLDLTRDASGNVTGGNVVFYVNYAFPGSVTLTGLALHQGAKGANGPVVLDAAIGTLTDADGRGNVTKVVSSVSPSLLQALLTSPRNYYVDISTSANPGGALRDQLESPERR